MIDPIDRAVGANIRRMRMARGITQSALAEPLGVTFQQLQKYEKGANRVSASKLVRIAGVLGCSLGDLFHDVQRAEAANAPAMVTLPASQIEKLRTINGYAVVVIPERWLPDLCKAGAVTAPRVLEAAE